MGKTGQAGLNKAGSANSKTARSKVFKPSERVSLAGALLDKAVGELGMHEFFTDLSPALEGALLIALVSASVAYRALC
ncbi:MAG: hypothetical protein RMK20_10915 [Verrucomicrobiales bacterium]|nr:hypothetical protein [Verrucomicrobiales bacterium]